MNDLLKQFEWKESEYGLGRTLLQKKPVEWSLLVQALKEYATEINIWRNNAKLYIPVTKDSFEPVEERYKKEIGEYRLKKIEEFINTGYIYTDKVELYNDTIEAYYCIDSGCPSDDGGYGAEPDIWLIATLDLQGNYIQPFRLKYWLY